MNDFSGQDYEFAAGSLFGLRGWDVDNLGRLHGVTHREVWRPGENVSVCKKTRQVPCDAKAEPRDHMPKFAPNESLIEPRSRRQRRKGRKAQESPYPSTIAAFEREVLGTWETRPRCGDPTCERGVHTVPSDHHYDASCDCGFWAYDEASFTPHGEVIGVIEAYGKNTIGTKGFRAEKARIVGLSRIDSEGEPLSRSLVHRLGELYPEVTFAAGLYELVGLFGGVLRTWGEVGEDFWSKPVPSNRAPSMLLQTGSTFGYSLPSSLMFGGRR